MSMGHPTDSLLLSFPSPRLHSPLEQHSRLPTLSPNFAFVPPHLPSTFSTSNISGYEQSPWSDVSALGSTQPSVSSHSWTDGEGNPSRPTSALSDQFYGEDVEFSISSFDGLSDVSEPEEHHLGGLNVHGRELTESPPHNSSSEDVTSPGRGPASISSWESVGSPTSSEEGRRRLH